MFKFLKKLFGTEDTPIPPKPTRLPTPPPPRPRTTYRESRNTSRVVDNTDYITPMVVANMFSDHGDSSHSHHDSSSYDSGGYDSGGCDGGGGCD